MKKLHLFIIKSFLGPFILTFFIVLFILLMQFLWKYIDDLIGKGLEWYIIAELMLYTSASLVPMALPLAILLSSIMTFGNLGEYYELTALKSAGLSLQKIMSPLIVTSVCISIAAFYFSNNILPIANLKMGALLWDIRQQKPALNIKKGIFYNGIDGYSIKIREKHKDGTFENIMIYDHTSKMGNNKAIIAKSGKMEMSEDNRYLILSLYNGYSYEEIDAYKRKAKNTRPLRRIQFREQTIRFDLSNFTLSRTNEDLFKDHHQMLNIKQLQMAEDTLLVKLDKRRQYIVSTLSNRYFFGKYPNMSWDKKETDRNNPTQSSEHVMPTWHGRMMKAKPERLPKAESSKSDSIKIIETAINQARSTKMHLSIYKNDIENKKSLIIKHQIEWHRKFTLAFACILLFFIGAPLGAIIRKGGLGMPLVVSVLFFLTFHVLSIISEKFVKEAVLLPYQGMWLTSAIFLPAGIFLIYKAATDSVIFDINMYTKFFKRLYK